MSCVSGPLPNGSRQTAVSAGDGTVLRTLDSGERSPLGLASPRPSSGAVFWKGKFPRENNYQNLQVKDVLLG